jgi:predicted extracellular nuclease
MKTPSFPLRPLVLVLALCLLVLAVAPSALAVPETPTTTNVFFNEIHYDNTGTDEGEAIEVAAPSGTDLTGWTVVLYNGSNGQSYDTDPLGDVAGTCGNYDLYVINYPTNGIQNGAPDGMALVDNNNTVIQFLSYEGTFTATNGPANGQTSTDIGVSQSGSGAVGNSLQLAGTGTLYSDFTWQAEGPNTFGACNTGQTFGEVSDTAPSVVSTDPTDSATGVAVDTTITINFSESVDVTADAFTIECPVNTQVAFSSSPTLPATGTTNVVLTPASDLPNDTTCTVTVVATEVTDKDGNPDNMAENYVFSFTTAAEVVAELIINEVDADTPGTDTAEFIELYDGGVGNTPLDGFVVVLYNGNGDVSYGAFDLDGYTTDANGYFLLGNAAVPGVDIVFAGNLLQNGADAVALYLGDAADFPNNTPVTTTNLVDAIVYDTDDPDDAGLLPLLNAGQPQVNENEGGKGADYANQRCPNGAGGARNTDTYDQFPPTPGEANLCPDFIHEIQGSGDTAAPGTFTVEAIVTGDYQGATGVDDWKLDGFFIQEEDRDVDNDPATSEGIFVYCATCPVDVVVGDKVRVTGASSEYFDMSQLSATTADAVVVVSSDNPLPGATAVILPVPGVTATDLAGAQAQINAYFEPFEGMLITIEETLSVTEYFELSRYGQLVLAQGGRFRQFTDANAPSAAGYTAHQIDLARRTIILDDDSNQQNHALFENVPVFHPLPGFSISNYVRGGATITNLTGVLHWSFAGQSGTDAWRIRPVMDDNGAPVYSYTFTEENPRPASPSVSGNVKVASFNVLNYFTTIDARGADSTAELDRQAAKIVAAFAGLNADVIGVMEIENNNDVAIADLVSRLNADAGAGTYAYIATGTVGTDQITVGIIYKPASVTPVGAVQTLTDAAFTDPNNTGTQRSRPAIAQTFEDNTWGERFTVIVNHLKSKGSCPGSGPDADQGDGQGCWNDTRQKAAAYLVNTWLPTDPTGSGDPDFLIIGDINAYRQEDPITAITGAGYTDLLNTLGPDTYGYVFDGQLGYLDHALSNPALTPQVAGVSEWRINADEVNLLDYNDTVKDPGEQNFEAKPSALPLYEDNEFRSSDHDPVLVGLELIPNQGNLPASYGLAWHTGDGALRLGVAWQRGPATADNDGVEEANGLERQRTGNIGWSNGTVAEGKAARLNITVTGGDGCIDAWIDWSGASEGDFNGPGDYVLQAEPVIARASIRCTSTFQRERLPAPATIQPSITAYG